jgi:hypothetical protein
MSRFFGFLTSWFGVQSHSWIHNVTDVWMNGWVLKKPSKEFDGIADDVKGIKQDLHHIYVCVPHGRNSTTHRDRSLLGK